MGVTGYFFDTYAIIELLRQSPSYERYSNLPIKITFLNLLEATYITYIQQGEDAAAKVYQWAKEFVIVVPDHVALAAVRFRAANQKKSLSYADCLGYMFAQMNNLAFLTGDDAFKSMMGVEFIK